MRNTKENNKVASWGKAITICIPDKGLISLIICLKVEKAIYFIEKWKREMNTRFKKKKCKWSLSTKNAQAAENERDANCSSTKKPFLTYQIGKNQSLITNWLEPLVQC